MTELKKFKSRNFFLLIILIVISIMAMFILGYEYIFKNSQQFYLVSSDSMKPNLNVNDLLYIERKTGFDELSIGDIIVFKPPGTPPGGENIRIGHRIVEITNEEDGDRIIKTKGDATNQSIRLLDFPIREENYFGKVEYVIPQIGLITNIVKPPMNYFLTCIILIISSIVIYKEWKKEKKRKEHIE